MKSRMYSIEVECESSNLTLWFTKSVWSQLTTTLKNYNLWLNRREIFANVLAKGLIHDWCPRVFFSGGKISGSEIELHPSATVASLLKFCNADAYKLVDAELNVRVAAAWTQLRRTFVLRRERLVPNGLEGFPAYDAPLRLVPKSSSGEFRKVALASGAHILAGRCLLAFLESYVDPILPIHGFRPNRSPVTNALSHLGFEFTLSVDLSNFFDHVTCDRLVLAGLPQSVSTAITDQEGIARQGYATSPVAANIAFQEVDRQILESVYSLCADAVYTRYADDLTISANRLPPLMEIYYAISEIIHRAGFLVCERKTKFQSASAGRRIITGVAVDKLGAHPTRYTRRKYRASVHKQNHLQARGLKEWMMLKFPRNF
jgi:hypothetical protein